MPIEQLGTLTTLRYLQISQNKIVEVPQNLVRLVSLEELDMANNKIKGVGPNCLPKGLSHLHQEVAYFYTTVYLFQPISS